MCEEYARQRVSSASCSSGLHSRTNGAKENNVPHDATSSPHTHPAAAIKSSFGVGGGPKAMALDTSRPAHTFSGPPADGRQVDVSLPFTVHSLLQYKQYVHRQSCSGVANACKTKCLHSLSDAVCLIEQRKNPSCCKQAQCVLHSLNHSPLPNTSLSRLTSNTKPRT